MPRIEQWAEIDVRGENSLIGYVYDDERVDEATGKFSNGHRIITSQLVSLDAEGKTAQTRNTLYQLGEPLQVTEKLTESNYDQFLPRMS